MRFGCCVNMVAKDAIGIGIDHVETLARLGYDYVELPLAQMMALEDADFTALVRRVDASGIKCEACNNFFPQTVRITGLAPSPKDIFVDYIDRAADRAERLGATSIVFGSSGTKNVPEGFDYGLAWKQIIELLHLVDDRFSKGQLHVAIEPLNRLESNIVQLASEGLALARDTDRSRIRLLIDFYHLTLENEAPEIALEAADFLQHMHIANPEGRVFPRSGDGIDYGKFLNMLKCAGYDGRVSVEAYSDDFENDAAAALAALRTLTSL